MILENILQNLLLLNREINQDPSIWWLLAPILILWMLIELYFGQYQQEKLGFSSAMANGISLFWINIISYRFFFLNSELSFFSASSVSFLLLLLITLYSIFIIYVSFTHRISENAINWLAWPSVVYPISLFAILLGQGIIIYEPFYILDLLLVFIFITLILWFIKKFFLGLAGEIEIIKNIK